MDRFIALFFALDHQDRVCRTEIRSTNISPSEDPSDFEEWALEQFGELADRHTNVGFAGVYSDPNEIYLTEDIMARVFMFEEARESDFFAQHDHNSDFYQNGVGRKSLEWSSDLAAMESLDLWYEIEDEIPIGARSHFSEYTLVYVDYEEEQVLSTPVFLHEDFNAALAKFLTENDILGVVGPIALFQGRIDPILTPNVLEQNQSFERIAHIESHPGALINVGEGALTAPGQHKNVPQVLAEYLTREAVANFAKNDTGDLAQRIRAYQGDPFEEFVRILVEKRPLVLFETQYWEIAEHVGRFISDTLSMDFVSANAYYEPYEQRRFNSKDRVIFYDDQLFAGDYELDRNSVRALIKDLVTSRDIGLMVVSNPRAVPLTFQNYMDMELALPPIVGPVRDNIFRVVLGQGAVDKTGLDSWTRYLLPFDFEKVLAAGYTGAKAVEELQERVDRRLARRAANNAPSLAEIHGLGEAKEIAEQLVNDIRLAVAGEIDWSEVDRGALFVGPPGTGKTMLARAISKESGIRFIAGSALEWQASGALDAHLASIREFFAEARRYAPTVVFIDEFDSIGNRQHNQGRNDYYTTAVVNCVLEELQGFHDREGVIVIAATNEAGKIDPALKRAGRLDQTVAVRRPNVPALALIFEYHISKLREKNYVKDPIDTEELAKLTFGQTGADVEFYVRGARRRARRDQRMVEQGDFVAEIMRRPLGTTGLPRMTEEEVRRTAVHEAGHALVQLLGPNKGAEISFISIIPRPDGSLGFVASYSDRVDIKKSDVLEQIKIFLAGRAAEEVVYGKENVGAGAGGSGSSDLAQATRLLVRMFLQHGYSENSGLLWFDVDQRDEGIMKLPDDVKKEVQQTLDKQYRLCVKLLRENQSMLERIVKLLLEKQEVTGSELRDIFSRGSGFMAMFGKFGGEDK